MKCVIRACLLVLACAGTSPLVARAQEPHLHPLEGDLLGAAAPAALVSVPFGQPAGPVPTPRHTGFRALVKDLFADVKHLPAVENAWIAGIGGGTALAVHPADSHATAYLADASWSHDVFALGAVLGDTPELLAASIAVYATGRLQDKPRVSHIGMDMLQGIMLNEAIVQTLKHTTQRERPDGSGADSFPSGHASNTFAVATVLERHFGWKGAIPAYAFASYVAASRLHDNRHYLSDVVFGAAVGTVAGRTVTRTGHDMRVAIAPVPGGAAIMYVRDANKPDKAD